MSDGTGPNPATESFRLEYRRRRPKVRRALPHSALDGWSTDAAALLVLVCSSLCLGALSWWLAVWGERGEARVSLPTDPMEPRETADPEWFRAPTRREHAIGAGLFVGFG